MTRFDRYDVLEAYFCFKQGLCIMLDSSLGYSKRIERIAERLDRYNFYAGWKLFNRFNELADGPRNLTPNGKRIYMRLIRVWYS